jgi:hypothetical protein
MLRIKKVNIDKKKLEEFERLIYKYKKVYGLNFVYIAFAVTPVFTFIVSYVNDIELFNNNNIIIGSFIFVSIIFSLMFYKNNTKIDLNNLIEYSDKNNELKTFFKEYIEKKRKLYFAEKYYLDTGNIRDLALTSNDLFLTDLRIYINSQE